MGNRWMSSSFWYQTCRNMLRNNWVNHLNKDSVEMKNCKCYKYINIQICSAICFCSIQLNGFNCNFSKRTCLIVSINQIIRYKTQLFLNIFLQVWYQLMKRIYPPASQSHDNAFNLPYNNYETFVRKLSLY